MPDFLSAYSLGTELFDLLQQKNGFYSFESALHVFPICDLERCTDLRTWNSDVLWRDAYKDLAEGLLFFAEDAVQDQFCLSTEGVVRFKAETGQTIYMAPSVERWAELILSNSSFQTGWPFLRDWQAKHGAIRPGRRLMPRTPFFLGCEYSQSNFWDGDAVEGMRFKADLALQTRDLPDGSKVKLHVAQPPPPKV